MKLYLSGSFLCQWILSEPDERKKHAIVLEKSLDHDPKIYTSWFAVGQVLSSSRKQVSETFLRHQIQRLTDHVFSTLDTDILRATTLGESLEFQDTSFEERLNLAIALERGMDAYLSYPSLHYIPKPLKVF